MMSGISPSLNTPKADLPAGSSAPSVNSSGVPQKTEGEKSAVNPNANFKDSWDKIQKTMGAKPDQVRMPKKKLDKDDFMKLMVTQLKHQDPTKPMDVEKMTSEMAQLASMEQLTNINQKLEKMSQANRPLEQLSMTGLIGKDITIDRNKFIHTQGEAQTLKYTLPEKANVTVALIAPNGEAAFQKELGEKDAGQNEFTWDGKKTGGILPATSGPYLLQIVARSPEGKIVPINTRQTTRVIGVSFNDKEPTFLVGTAGSNERVPLSNVVSIDGNGSPQTASIADTGVPGAGPLPSSGGSRPAPPDANIIPFKVGVGSVKMNEMDDQAKKVLNNFAIQHAAAKQKKLADASAAEAGPANAVEERGFPNGLGEVVSEEGEP